MSDPIDIKALDEYLKGGSDISQHYRELGRDEVPPELDRRVLEAARTAVASDGAKRSRSWLRWSAPLALAASVVLVVTVVIESGVQKDAMLAPPSPAAERTRDAAEQESSKLNAAKLDQEPASPPAQEQFVQEAPLTVVSETVHMPAAAPASLPPPSLAKAESKRASNGAFAASEEVREDAPASKKAQVAAERPAPSLAPQVETTAARNEVDRVDAQPEADDSAEVGEVAATSSRARRATGRTAGPRNTISSSAAGAALAGEMRSAADEAQRADPDKWLEEIRDLRRAGKAGDADREWKLFREAFPDFRVADDDLARKKP